MTLNVEHLTDEQVAHYNALIAESGDMVDLGSVFGEMASRYQKEFTLQK